MNFLLFSDSAETQFKVRKIVSPTEDLLITTKDEWLFFRIIQLTEFDLFLIDLNSSCLFSDLRAKMGACKLNTPWILLTIQSNLSFQSYLNYWKALNGITSYSDDFYNGNIEEKLKMLAVSIRKKEKLEISKNAKKLLDFFIEFQNKSISIEMLQEKVFGESSSKNRNLLYGLIHEIRKAIGDDLSCPKDLIRFKKGRYKLVNAFPENSLDVCIYGNSANSEHNQYVMLAEKSEMLVW